MVGVLGSRQAERDLALHVPFGGALEAMVPVATARPTVPMARAERVEDVPRVKAAIEGWLDLTQFLAESVAIYRVGQPVGVFLGFGGAFAVTALMRSKTRAWDRRHRRGGRDHRRSGVRDLSGGPGRAAVSDRRHPARMTPRRASRKQGAP